MKNCATYRDASLALMQVQRIPAIPSASDAIYVMFLFPLIKRTIFSLFSRTAVSSSLARPDRLRQFIGSRGAGREENRHQMVNIYFNDVVSRPGERKTETEGSEGASRKSIYNKRSLLL